MAVSTTTTTPTGWAADAAYQNWQQAQAAINRPYQAYGGNMLAGFSPYQNAAIQQTAQNYGGAAMQAGSNAAQNAANYSPMQVSGTGMQAVGAGPAASIPVTNMQAASAGPASLMGAASAGPASLMQAAQFGRGNVRDVAAQNFLSRDVNAYMNPYINTVIDNSLRDLSRQNDIVNNTTNARAAAAGAFGGSRQAVANTLNNENFLRESGNLSGNLRNQGYNTAAQLIGQDNDRDLQAQGMNQSMDWNVGQMNTMNQQAANRANIDAANQMNQYNATNQQNASLNNINAANNMAQYNAGNQQQANQYTAAAHNAASNSYANAQNALAQFNATNQQAANQFNSNQAVETQLANQAAGQNAAQLWNSAGNALNGMGLDQQRWNSNNANALWGMGQSQQAQQQAELDNAYQQWQQEYNYPLTQADQRRAALQGAPTGTATNTPYYSNTGAQVLAGGIGAAQLASAIPGAVSGIKAAGNALGGLLGGGSSVIGPANTTMIDPALGFGNAINWSNTGSSIGSAIKGIFG